MEKVIKKDAKLKRSEFLKIITISGAAIAGDAGVPSQIKGMSSKEEKVENISEKLSEEIVKNNVMLRMQCFFE